MDTGRVDQRQRALWMRFIRGAGLLGAATAVVAVGLFILGSTQQEEVLRNTAVVIAPFCVMLLTWAGLMRWLVARQTKESGDQGSDAE